MSRHLLGPSVARIVNQLTSSGLVIIRKKMWGKHDIRNTRARKCYLFLSSTVASLCITMRKDTGKYLGIIWMRGAEQLCKACVRRNTLEILNTVLHRSFLSPNSRWALVSTRFCIPQVSTNSLFFGLGWAGWRWLWLGKTVRNNNKAPLAENSASYRMRSADLSRHFAQTIVLTCRAISDFLNVSAYLCDCHLSCWTEKNHAASGEVNLALPRNYVYANWFLHYPVPLKYSKPKSKEPYVIQKLHWTALYR